MMFPVKLNKLNDNDLFKDRGKMQNSRLDGNYASKDVSRIDLCFAPSKIQKQAAISKENSSQNEKQLSSFNEIRQWKSAADFFQFIDTIQR